MRLQPTDTYCLVTVLYASILNFRNPHTQHIFTKSTKLFIKENSSS